MIARLKYHKPLFCTGYDGGAGVCNSDAADFGGTFGRRRGDDLKPKSPCVIPLQISRQR